MFKEPKFAREQVVFHAADGERGVVIDICYYFSTKHYEYYISFGAGKSFWVNETEVSATKVFC